MSNKIVKTSIIIVFIALVSRLTGFIRDMAFAASYGLTINSDAFIMAQSIIEVINGLIFMALGTTFIPVMSNYLSSKSKAEINRFLNIVYTYFVLIAIIMCITGIVFTEQIVKLFAPNFAEEVYVITVQLTRIIFPSIILSLIATLNSSKLKNHGVFLIPSMMGMPMNLVMIVTMIIFNEMYSIHSLAYAVTFGALLQIALLYPSTKRLGYRFKLNFNYREDGFKQIIMLTIPVIIGSGIRQINIIVDKILSSGLREGSLSALTFSSRLNVFIIVIFLAPVISVYYTTMSNYYSKGKKSKFKNLLRSTINILAILVIPASVGLYVLRLPIVKLVYERGIFDTIASDMTANALRYYTIGLIGFALRDVLSRAFYAIKDTKSVMINGSIAVILNIIVSVILVPYLGVAGIAIGTSVSGLFGTVLLMVSLHLKIGDYGIKNIVITFSKVFLASVLMGIVVDNCYRVLMERTLPNVKVVIVSVLIGIVMYTITLLMLNIKEVDELKKLILFQLGFKSQH